MINRWDVISDKNVLNTAFVSKTDTAAQNITSSIAIGGDLGIGGTLNVTGAITGRLSTSLTPGSGLTGSAYNGSTARTWSIASHAGTAGSIGTVNVGTATIGVNLGTTSTTAFRGDYGNSAYAHISNNGSDHSYINQSVTSTATPTFRGLKINHPTGPHTANFITAYGSSTSGLGAYIQGGGALILGGGESAATVSSNLTADVEQLWLTSDNIVKVMTNIQSGYASRKEWSFGTDGNLSAPGDVSAVSVSTGTIQSTDPLSILNVSAAQKINTGGLLASNAYADASKVPSNGIYSKGSIIAAADIKSVNATSTIIYGGDGATSNGGNYVDIRPYSTSYGLLIREDSSASKWANFQVDSVARPNKLFVSYMNSGSATTNKGIDLDTNGNVGISGTVTWSGGGSANANSAYTHISSTGIDHSYINQSVTTTATPSFVGMSLSDMGNDSTSGITFIRPSYGDFKMNMAYGELHLYPAAITVYTGFSISQAGNVGIGIRPDDTNSHKLKVSGSLDCSSIYVGNSRKDANWDSAYTHIASNGTSHSYINQSVTTSASPAFAGLTVNGLTRLKSSTAGIQRVLALDIPAATAGNGAAIQFMSSTTDGYGPMIGGLRPGSTAAGDFFISTGSNNPQERIRVLDDGKVGIHTSAPSETLEIGGTNAKVYLNSATSNMLIFGNAGLAIPTFATRSAGTKIVLYDGINTDRADYAIGADAGTVWYSVPSSSATYSHKFYAGTTEIMKICGDKKVGIATGSPEYTLHVADGTSGTVALGQSTIYGDALIKGVTGTSGYMSLGFSAGTDATADTENVEEALVIQRTGKVGIGVASPSQALDVAGNIKLGNYLYSTATFIGFLGNSSAALPVKAASLVLSSSYSDTAPTNGAYIKGKVGINIASPTEYLEVAGNIRAEGNLILNAATPEILFNGTSDGSVDIAIKATPEGLDFYEPEDSNKIQFKIEDDTGVDAPFGYKVNGNSVISSARAVSCTSVTSTGAISGTAITGTSFTGIRAQDLPLKRWRKSKVLASAIVQGVSTALTAIDATWTGTWDSNSHVLIIVDGEIAMPDTDYIQGASNTLNFFYDIPIGSSFDVVVF